MMTINSVLMVILGCLQSMVHSVKTCGLKDVVILMTGIKIVGMKQKLKLTLDAVLEYTRSMFG